MERMPAARVAVSSLAAWAVLWWWAATPGGARFGHTRLERSPAPLAYVLVGWIVMTVAMMLPTLSRPTPRERVHVIDAALFPVGYLSVWILAGIVAITLDLIVHATASSSIDLRPGVFALAGAYQFTRHKQRCLTHWRPSVSWVAEAGEDRWCVFDRGARQGWRSVGCCWALMLLAFALGMRDLVWTVAIAAAMFVETRSEHPERWSYGAGLALISASIIA